MTASHIALIVAGGRGYRAGGDLPKQYQSIAGKTLLRHTIDAFKAMPFISDIQVVIHPDDLTLYDAAVIGLDLPAPVLGGKERQDSVRHGLERLNDSFSAESLVFIHDAARPFPDAAAIRNSIDLFANPEIEAALLAAPVADTLKRADTDHIVGDTVDRNGLWRAMTPQIFRLGRIHDAHQDYAGEALTDDAGLMEACGHKVHLVPCSEDNFKVTQANDVKRAERMMMQQLGDIRMGQGYDVHAFDAGDKVTLCGVDIDHTASLKGHSDADVAMHALTDAIFAALCEGDIGHHFPPTDPQWKGVASQIFLEKARDLVSARGGMIAHAGVLIICEAPKIGPHRDKMQTRLADILGMPVDRISVQATTTEKLGFTGRREGIAAQASATIRLPL